MDWINRDFEATQNADFRQEVVLGAPGEVWSLDGATIYAQLRDPPLPAALNLAPYITVLLPQARKLLIKIPASALKALPVGTYPYDLIIKMGSQRRRRLAGRFKLETGESRS